MPVSKKTQVQAGAGNKKITYKEISEKQLNRSFLGHVTKQGQDYGLWTMVYQGRSEGITTGGEDTNFARILGWF